MNNEDFMWYIPQQYLDQSEKIAELERRLEKMQQAGDYMVAEIKEDWELGRISIDTKTAAEAWERLETERTKDLYNELIMAVHTKFPNETRHETALRYIRQREMGVMTRSEEQSLKAALMKSVKIVDDES